MRNTVGYFREASKFGGFSNQYWMGAPPAPAAVKLSGCDIAVWFSPFSFSFVSCFKEVPSKETRNNSGGAVSVDFEKITKPDPAWIWLMVPPFVTSFGAPPETATE